MVGLAVDDRGDALAGISAHAPPDFHDVATGGVNHITSSFRHLVHERCGGTEGRDDHHVVRTQIGIVSAHIPPWQRDDAHLAQVSIDVGVVDDFTDEENAVVRENPARGVGEVDGAFHAVAKPELFGEQQRGVAKGDLSAAVAEFFYDG